MAKTPNIDLREDYSRNYIINGNFDFWQRGTSSTVSAVYLADRWINNVGTLTFQRSTDTPSELNSQYSMRVTGNGALSPGISQRIEQQNIAHLLNKTVTFSFYVKVSSGTQDIRMSLQRANAIDDWSATTVVSDVSVGIANSTWQRFSFTTTVTLEMAQNGFNMFPYAPTLTSSVDFFVAGLMMTEGAEVLSFRRAGKNISEELRMCQRYFERLPSGIVAPLGTGFAATTIVGRVDFKYQVQKRTIPTVSYSGTNGISCNRGTGTADGVISSVSAGSDAGARLDIDINVSVLTAGEGIWAFKNTNGQIDIEAEL